MNQFPLFTKRIPMIGRARIFKRMVDQLVKTTPQSLSLVGPRFSGKSVLLTALAGDQRIRNHFACVIEWDLGHQIPQTDEEFLSAMRQKIAAGLQSTHKYVFQHLTKEGAGYDELQEVIELLETEQQRILILWDGVDPTLGSGRLTRNLWDNLLALGRMDSLVLVTSSRRKLQELIRDGESVTSEFWQLFDVVRLEPLAGEDVEAFAQTMAGHEFQLGAVKELRNWTGGIPPLVVWLLNRICEEISGGMVGNGQVNDLANQPDERCTGILEAIWSDCPAPAADLYRQLAESGPQQFASLPKAERSALVTLGIAAQTEGKLADACRLMNQHVSGANPESGALGRMFGTWGDYRKNVRGILERRISHIPRFDETLFHMVERGIEDIPDHPDVCLTNLTHIEERTLDLIWSRELGVKRLLPQEVISYWTEDPRSKHKSIAGMMEADNWEVSGERGPQLSLLQLLTGSHQHFTQPMAKFTSKDTYVLLNAIHSFRNRNQHAGGQLIHLGVAVSAIMLCIELLGCLARESSSALDVAAQF